jgi:hypothetical protein
VKIEIRKIEKREKQKTMMKKVMKKKKRSHCTWRWTDGMILTLLYATTNSHHGQAVSVKIVKVKVKRIELETALF